MHYIVPIAGESRRFREVGVSIPKWSILINGHPILSLAIKSLPATKNDRMTIVCLEKDKPQLEELIGRIDLGIKLLIKYLPSTPAGQALTVLAALLDDEPNLNEPITIWCGDSFTTPEALQNVPKTGNWLACAKMAGDHWSFVKSISGRVVETAEKKRISEYASIGLYGFRCREDYINLVSRTPKFEGLQELYIAPLYNNLISAGEIVNLYEIDPKQYYCAGTPQELKLLSHKYGWSIEYS